MNFKVDKLSDVGDQELGGLTAGIIAPKYMDTPETRETQRLLEEARLKYPNANWSRPSWDDYFISITEVVAQRSNCLSRKVGSIVVRDRRILSTGYNGTPSGVPNCNEGGCPRCLRKVLDPENYPSAVYLGECMCSHAEENAITQAARYGVSIHFCTIYSPMIPCIFCSKLIINAGIDQVIYKGGPGWEAYTEMGKESLRMFIAARISVKCLNKVYEVKL